MGLFTKIVVGTAIAIGGFSAGYYVAKDIYSEECDEAIYETYSANPTDGGYVVNPDDGKKYFLNFDDLTLEKAAEKEFKKKFSGDKKKKDLKKLFE